MQVSTPADRLIRRIDLTGNQDFSRANLRNLLPRAEMDIEAALVTVKPLLERIKKEGEKVVIAITAEIDGVEIPQLRVPAKVIQKALDELDPKIKAALLEAIKRIEKVHRDQTRSEKQTDVVPGGYVVERWIPVDRVGLYVPGGKAVYPSSVMMNVIPAKIAGVKSFAVTSPPQKDFGGYPHPTILATCALLGVDEIYSVGGAQAIGMFAYGAGCEAVDIVTGPGNIYVAAAKRALRGVIGIDSEAGPTEIMVLADESAKAENVAADLISQAEHDTIAAAVLVTTSVKLADDVEIALKSRVNKTKHSARISTALSGIQSAIVIVKNLEDGLAVVNAYGAEHLEIQTNDAVNVAKLVRNAGAVFIGPYTPVSLGDYSAGSNHVLPTGGCACHSSGLSVQTFLRGIHFVEYNEKAFTEIAENVITLANSEDLPAHGEAMSARFLAKGDL
jgi:histidinol dehydrogenase